MEAGSAAGRRRSAWGVALVLALAALARAPALAADEDGWARATAREHAGDRPVPSPALADPPASERALDEREVVYARVGGADARGFLVRPAGASDAPGLIVIHEWWGLNDNVRAMARRLAGQGMAALAVDLYEGRSASDPDTASRLMQRAMAHPEALRENLRQARDFLAREGAPRVGVIGWCFGGGWALDTALDQGDRIAAAVVYYGRPVTDPERLARLRAPLLGLFAGRDHSIPPDSVRRLETQLHELGKSAEIHVYPDADHAFANPSGTRYDAAAARDAWSRTTAFLAAHLGRSGPSDVPPAPAPDAAPDATPDSTR